MSLTLPSLRRGANSFFYEAFSANEYQLNEDKRGFDAIYKYVRKSDEQYLTYVDGLGEKTDECFKNYCNVFFLDSYALSGEILP